MDRREFLKAAVLSSFSLSGLNAWAYNAPAKANTQKKLIVIFLRGGIDGLNVVVPYADQDYYRIRPNIAVAPPGQANGCLDLDGHFGLHPSLNALMPLWQNKSLAFIHSSGSPDPTRSHFDAQDFMETGTPGEKFSTTGWMNRLIAELPKAGSPVQALSVGPVLPRIFAGPSEVATVERAGGRSRSVIDRPVVGSNFKAMYEGRNDELGGAFEEGMAAHKTINDTFDKADADDKKEQMLANRGAPVINKAGDFGKQLSTLFKRNESTQIAFIDFGGWDTHINEGNGKGQLANKLTPLGDGLAGLVQGLGSLYDDTTILVMSEFGRTAKENGNAGTDHGHGNVMWVLGGGTPGGHVYGRWQGLAQNQLHESRDLPTTTDFRSVLTSTLNEQMQISQNSVQKIFPDFKRSGNPFVIA